MVDLALNIVAFIVLFYVGMAVLGVTLIVVSKVLEGIADFFR
jgi:hypothetical protein